MCKEFSTRGRETKFVRILVEEYRRKEITRKT
jgi:hypothetical protein